MGSIKIALLLFICLGAYALASPTDGVANTPEGLPANGDICKDCTQIFELLVDLFSSPDLQKKVMDAIDRMCDHLPGPPGTAKICKEEVEKFFPVAITFITSFVKPADVCKSIGLCGSSDQQKLLHYLVIEALQAVDATDNGNKECSFCIFLIKTLEDLLPKQRTEDIVVKVLQEICHIVPAASRPQCQEVVGRFTKSIIEALLHYATPQAICALIRMCDGQEAPVADPCTLTTYRCRDMKTALECGTLFYCQKFAWKPLSDNTR